MLFSFFFFFFLQEGVTGPKLNQLPAETGAGTGVILCLDSTS